MTLLMVWISKIHTVAIQFMKPHHGLTFALGHILDVSSGILQVQYQMFSRIIFPSNIQGIGFDILVQNMGWSKV